ncbi:3052_t:CDS:2 [Funneliformis caledonium]|uniref:3052_t:CDS:1 n=1 Tax=Funneliformis caledonium TaxID=1117310 RepID=A0A9N9AXC8_9GLOM|nr:3052_t:CDS:2 [Funneliformis caledonium]
MNITPHGLLLFRKIRNTSAFKYTISRFHKENTAEHSPYLYSINMTTRLINRKINQGVANKF